FIGFLRRFRLVAQLLRLAEIALDLVLPRIDHPADARQRNPREDEIERDKGDGERHQLRGEGRRVKWRKYLFPAISLGAGAMTFSHGFLLLGSDALPPPGAVARDVSLRLRTAAAARSAARRCRALRSRRSRRSGCRTGPERRRDWVPSRRDSLRGSRPRPRPRRPCRCMRCPRR